MPLDAHTRTGDSTVGSFSLECHITIIARQLSGANMRALLSNALSSESSTKLSGVPTVLEKHSRVTRVPTEMEEVFFETRTYFDRKGPLGPWVNSLNRTVIGRFPIPSAYYNAVSNAHYVRGDTVFTRAIMLFEQQKT